MREEKLIKDCLKGRRKAQNIFYDRYKAMLMHVSIRYASRDEDKDDIFQEAFVKVFKNLGQLKEPKALDSWVYQCAVRVAINHYKKSRQLSALVHQQDHVEVPNEEYESILEGFSGQEIMQLVAQLPEGQKLVFNMAVIDGFKHKEIAAELNITENTSRSQLLDARNTLKKLLLKRGVCRYEGV